MGGWLLCEPRRGPGCLPERLEQFAEHPLTRTHTYSVIQQKLPQEECRGPRRVAAGILPGFPPALGRQPRVCVEATAGHPGHETSPVPDFTISVQLDTMYKYTRSIDGQDIVAYNCWTQRAQLGLISGSILFHLIENKQTASLLSNPTSTGRMPGQQSWGCRSPSRQSPLHPR